MILSMFITQRGIMTADSYNEKLQIEFAKRNGNKAVLQLRCEKTRPQNENGVRGRMWANKFHVML